MHLITDRYLQGSLSEGEQIEFEERLVWDQELIDELDLAEHMRAGLKASVSDSKYTASEVDVGFVSRMSDLVAVPQYAAAASFLLAVTLTAGVLLNPFSPGDGNQVVPSTPTQIIPLFATRGTDAQSIVVSDQAWTVLLVDAVGSYTSYRVSVRTDEPASEPLWVQDNIMPTYPESLAIGMPGNLLSDGSYVLTVEGVRDSEGTEKTYEHVQDLPFDSDTAQ